MDVKNILVVYVSSKNVNRKELSNLSICKFIVLRYNFLVVSVFFNICISFNLDFIFYFYLLAFYSKRTYKFYHGANFIFNKILSKKASCCCYDKNYKTMSTFSQELNADEKVVAAHLKEDVTFFGSTKEQLICSFLVLNGCCFCNETTALDLFVSEVEDVRLLAFTYAFFFSLTLIYTLILEVYIIFYFNHPTEHPLFLATKRLGKLVFAGAVNAYTFDRVCLSGDWDPPTNFGFVRDYQVSKLGCVATTKKALKSLTQYKDLGIKEPLPLIGDTKDLDVEILNDRIQTRVILLEFYAEQKKKLWSRPVRSMISL